MRILFGIQLTGNGHINRSQRLISELRLRGHKVDVVVSGSGNSLDYTDYKFRFRGFSIYSNSKGGINWIKTIFSNNPFIVLFESIKLKSVDYDIYFESGIDDFGGWLNVMKDYGIVKQAGAWYTYIDKVSGEEVKFQSKDFHSTIMSNPELKETIYNEICENYILRYTPGTDIGIDDIEISDDLIPED